jgi:RNase adaptor protein for sRNA GlmZ degradation
MKFLPVILAASLLGGCGAKTSDEEQVRALIDAVEIAAEDRDASDVLTHVADNYIDSAGLDKTQLQNFLRGYFLAHPKLELLVTIESLVFR